MVALVVKKFYAFMEPKVLSSCSQKHYITPYPNPAGSSPQFQTLFLLDPFKYYPIIYV
jgi:hypothetical protein